MRDSALTNHGVQQAQRLGQFFAKEGVSFTHIYSSDLQRAVKTAEAIRTPQLSRAKSTLATNASVAVPCPSMAPVEEDDGLKVLQSRELREQDFGYYEGKPFYARSPNSKKTGKEEHRSAHKEEEGFQDVESKESMGMRGDKFLDEVLLPMIMTAKTGKGLVVAIVSHGIMLSALWRCILRRQHPNTVAISSEILAINRPISLEHLGGWANTGYLEIELCDKSPLSRKPKINEFQLQQVLATEQTATEVSLTQGLPADEARSTVPSEATAQGAPAVSSMIRPSVSRTGVAESSDKGTLFTITIKTINGKEHLKGLKRTGGGVGSSKFDEGQKSIETFFKRQKPN